MTTAVTQEQGYTGLALKIPRVVTTSTLAQVTTAGWWNNNQVASGQPALTPQDLVAICHDYGTSSQSTDIFAVSISKGIVTLVLAESDIVLPTEIGELAVFNNAYGQLTTEIPAINSVSNESATPGTVRALYGEISSSLVTTVTSGNLVGVRGAVYVDGTSTSAYIYGVQGKFIAQGTIASGQFQAGVFGQLDISAATINAGQIAPIWGDYGTSSGTLTDQTGLYGIALTNTTAAVLAGQIYLYGGATNLLLLNTNAGLSGTTYFKAAGSGSSSAGHAGAAEVLQINVNSTTYYIGLWSSNS